VTVLSGQVAPVAGSRRVRLHRSDLLTALLGLLGVLAVVATLTGVRLVPVLTGSMAPGMPAGSLALTTRLAAEDVRPGQVVAFRPPSAYAREGGRLVLHRVVSATVTPTGLETVTRGDANAVRDPWTLSLGPDAELGRERLSVPHLGRIVAGGPLAAASLLLGLAMLVVAVARSSRGGRRTCDCPGHLGERHTTAADPG
jgi:signal peptidase